MHSPFFSYLTLAINAAFLFAPTLAYADATDIARKLLEDAKQLKDEDKLAEACPLLDRSYELDAKDGVLFARADCRDQENKIATAVNLYAAYLRAYSRMTGESRDNHAERAAAAEKRIEELTPRIPAIKFVWAAAPPANAKIIVDRVEYRASTLESRLPLDPGSHEIVVQLSGESERRRTITLSEGGATVVDLTPLPPRPEAVNLDKLLSIGPLSPRSRLDKPKRKAPVDGGKVSGFVGIGLGAAAVAAGSIFGYWAANEKDTIDAHCDKQYACDRLGMEAVDRMAPMANTSTALFIAGGVVAGVGATLLIVAYRQPSHQASTALRVQVGPHQTQIGITGAF